MRLNTFLFHVYVPYNLALYWQLVGPKGSIFIVLLIANLFWEYAPLHQNINSNDREPHVLLPASSICLEELGVKIYGAYS